VTVSRSRKKKKKGEEAVYHQFLSQRKKKVKMPEEREGVWDCLGHDTGKGERKVERVSR